jgi:hypothetical protein
VGDRYIVTLKLINADSVDVVGRGTRMIPKDENTMVDTMVQLVGEVFAPLDAAKDAASGPKGVAFPYRSTVKETDGETAGPYRGAAKTGAKPIHSHEGFYLRMAAGLGVGFGAVSGSADGDFRMSGLAADLMLSIGYSVIPNLSVTFDIFTDSIISARITGTKVGDGDDMSQGFMGFGAGVNWYFMPSNAFIGGSLGVGSSFVAAWRPSQNGGQLTLNRYNSAGFMMQVMGGREWWVSDNWGVGVAGQYILSVFPSTDSGTLVSHGLCVLVTATYN